MVLKKSSGYSNIVTHLRQAVETSLTTTARGNAQRNRAWQQFILEPTGTEKTGQSSVQSADVNSMITAVCAQMVISFSTDAVVTFEAESAEDEEGAASETRAVNKVAIQDNGGFGIILGGVQNALMYRNGYLKCFWDSQISKSTSTLPGITEELLPIAMDTADEQGNPTPGLVKRLISYNPEKQTATIELTMTKKKLKIDTVANERFFMTPDWDRLSLHDCPMTGEVHYKTRNDLVRMGVDQKIVDEIPATVRNSGLESDGRRRKNNTTDPVVKAMEICRVFEVYAWLTMDEDSKSDIAYLYRCWIGDGGGIDWLLDPEAVGRVPYASGTAFPIANRHHGEALSDKQSSIQAGKTELWRQWIDNVKNCSFGRYGAVAGQVEAADILNPKAGGPIRMKNLNSIVPIPVIDVGQSIGSAMALFDKERTERGGAALDMVASEQQLAQDTAHGTERVYASKELLVSYMTRNLAESMIRGMYLLAHAELRDGQNGPIGVKVDGQWTQVDPASWPERTYCNVKMGYSMGERTQIAGTLLTAMQMYQAGLAGGLEGQIVSLPGYYKMICDWLTINLVDNPEAYFVDPSSQEAQQAGQQKSQQAAAQAKATADQAAQIAALPEQIAADKDKYKADQDTAFKYFNAVLTAQTDASNAERSGVIDFAKARSEAADIKRANAGSAGSASGTSTGKPASGSGGKPASGKPSKPRK